MHQTSNGAALRQLRPACRILALSILAGLMSGAYAYSTSRSQVDLSAGLNPQKMFGFRYNTDLTLSVWNLNRAISQNYTQFANAVYDQNDPGRSYTMSLRTTF